MGSIPLLLVILYYLLFRLQQTLSQKDEEILQLQAQVQERTSAIENKQLRIDELEQNQKVCILLCFCNN